MSGSKKESKFVLVDKNEYPKLKAVLSKRLPQSGAMHNAVQLALTGTSEMEFYAYQARIDDQALLVGIGYVKGSEEDKGFPWVELSTTAEPTNITEELAKAFVAHLQPEAPQKFRPMMLGIMHETTPAVIKAFLDQGATINATPNQGCCYPLEKLVDVGAGADKPPAGLIVKALEPKHATLVASSWKYGALTAGGTEATVRGYILRNPSAAVLSADDPDKPMSWATCYDFGKLGMLFTPENYRGRGYAALVMKRMVTEMAARGLVPTCAVDVGNKSSLTTNFKAGYVNTHLLDSIFVE